MPTSTPTSPRTSRDAGPLSGQQRPRKRNRGALLSSYASRVGDAVRPDIVLKRYCVEKTCETTAQTAFMLSCRLSRCGWILPRMHGSRKIPQAATPPLPTPGSPRGAQLRHRSSRLLTGCWLLQVAPHGREQRPNMDCPSSQVSLSWRCMRAPIAHSATPSATRCSTTPANEPPRNTEGTPRSLRRCTGPSEGNNAAAAPAIAASGSSTTLSQSWTAIKASCSQFRLCTSQSP